MNENVIKLDKEAKIFLLDVIKKGYFDEADSLKLSRYFVFNVPINDWVNKDVTKHKKSKNYETGK